MRHPLLVALAASAVLTACGSTVQVQGQAQGGGNVGLGQVPSDGTTTATGGGSTGAVSAGGTSSTGGSSTAGSSALPGGAGTASGTGTSSGGSTSGGTSSGSVTTVTKPAPISNAPAKLSAVELGVVIFPDVNAAAKSFGGSADVGNQRDEVNASIAWVNAHGGLAGHRVSPVFFEVSLTSTQTYAVTYQQVCSQFTQDHHVVATILVGNAEAGLPSCLNKTKSLFLANGHYMHTLEDYRSLQNLITPNEVSSARVARTLAKEILAKGFVRSGDTLGLLVMDYAAPQRARDEIIVPAMKAAGVKVVSYTIPYPQSTQDISNSASAVQSAELAMASAGVKNVTFMCPGCVSFFMQDAESQAYYPRYIQTSLDTVGGLKGKGHGKSLASTYAIGWDPIRDVGTYNNPGLLGNNDTYKQCLTIEKANVVSDPSLFASVAFCGAMLDLYAAANANPVQTLTGPSLMAGFGALGTSHAGSANFTTVLGADKHDGTSAYRTMHYDTGCDCLLYDNATNRSFS